MPSNIDFGVHQAVLATLRENGLDQAAAQRLFAEHMADAYRVFGTALKEVGQDADGFDFAFGELKKWTQALA